MSISVTASGDGTEEATSLVSCASYSLSKTSPRNHVKRQSQSRRCFKRGDDGGGGDDGGDDGDDGDGGDGEQSLQETRVRLVGKGRMMSISVFMLCCLLFGEFLRVPPLSSSIHPCHPPVRVSA